MVNKANRCGRVWVGLSANELVDDGHKEVTSLAIVMFGVHPLELNMMEARGYKDRIVITHAVPGLQALDPTKKEVWLGKLRQCQTQLNALVLQNTLKKMTTEIARAMTSESSIGKDTTTLTLGPALAGLEFSGDYFAHSADENSWVLQLVPLPYGYDANIGDTKAHYEEVTVVWRAYFDKTTDDLQDEKAATQNNMDLLAKMMKGTNL